MLKLLGPENDLMTEDGKITKWGYLVAAIGTAFGICVFLAGRAAFGKTRR